MIPTPSTTPKDPLTEIGHLDKALDMNRILLIENAPTTDIPKVRARIDELLEQRWVWMTQRNATKQDAPKLRRPNKRVKRGVDIPKDQDL